MLTMADRRPGSPEDATASGETADADREREGSEEKATNAKGSDEPEATARPETDPASRSGVTGTDASGETNPGGDTDSNEDAGSNGDADVSRSSETARKTDDDTELEELRRAVESEYDFEDFGPEEMAEMSYEEWEAVFDHESWITGTELLDRVGDDLRSRVADREVFARIERLAADPAEGEPERLLAYSDEGYAMVYPDGSVDGRGTVLRDVKPTVALCSMDEYEVEEPPEGEGLPAPSSVPEGSGELGNFMLQITAAIQLLAGGSLFVAWIALDLTIIAPVVSLVFVLAGAFLFLVVANARLSDRFRAEEYRNRLRAVGLESGERPDFLPVESEESGEESDSTT
jgi:hypothetical protein